MLQCVTSFIKKLHNAHYTSVYKLSYILLKMATYVCGRQNCDTCNKWQKYIIYYAWSSSARRHFKL